MVRCHQTPPLLMSPHIPSSGLGRPGQQWRLPQETIKLVRRTNISQLICMYVIQIDRYLPKLSKYFWYIKIVIYCQMYLTHLASCKCREAPITILDQLIYLVNQKKSHNTIIRVCACVWSRASGPITQPSHHPATDHETNITFDVFCPRMVR